MDERLQLIDYVMKELKERCYVSVCPLSVEAYVTKEPVPYDMREIGEKRQLALSDTWGELFDCAWLNLKGAVPGEVPFEDLAMRLDVSGEGLVVDGAGNPVQGITTVTSTFDRSLGRPGKEFVYLSSFLADADELSIWVDCGCNDLFGKYADSGRLKRAEVVRVDQAARSLWHDFSYLRNLCQTACENTQEESYGHRLRHDLYASAIYLLEHGYDGASVRTAAERLKKYLNVTVRYEEDFEICAIGHGHMDLAWLWPIRETKRKGARTLSTVLEMMKRYPDYVFGASQPQLFEWMKEGYPALYERLREAVIAGRIECQGGMWVESDTNVPSGEALIRQLLYGTRYFKEEFGKEVNSVWLPDAFGYSAALPQIMKHAGMRYFMTTKLSWNQHNVFPYHTFYWKGIDGTRVLAHMPPEGTYNSAARPESFAAAMRNYKEKELGRKVLMLFGIGDGGGGPGEEHLENLKRARTSVAVPVVRQMPSEQFFSELSQEGTSWPTWDGELYLEKHQGTFTTHAKNKKYNRQMEFLLRECEFASVLAQRLAGHPYPKEDLEEIWKEVLLYQFHDILPGSSIGRVYEESQLRYQDLLKRTKEMTDAAYRSLADRMDVAGMKRPVVYFNSLPWERELPLWTDGGRGRIKLPPMGYRAYDLDDPGTFGSQDGSSQGIRINGSLAQGPDSWTLENDRIRIKVEENGALSSLYDKRAERELCPSGEVVNQFVLYPDMGDCWDFPNRYRDLLPMLPTHLKTERLETCEGSGIKQWYSMGSSRMEVSILLSCEESRILFKVWVDWQEAYQMLRVRLPFALRAAKAKCEIQFGHVERELHTNTSWDQAKLEVIAHKWVDMSENGYGVAVLNDCKYGYHLFDGGMEMNVLRSPSYPSEEEKGEHTFCYSIYPHEGNLSETDVIEQAYYMQVPSEGYETAGGFQDAPLRSCYSLLQCDAKNIVTETVKNAEDGTGSILRLYEAFGCRTHCRLRLAGAARVMISDACERVWDEQDISDGECRLEFSAFEIKTLKVIWSEGKDDLPNG